MHVELRHKLFWSVRLIAKNGEPLLTSETYYSKSNAKRAAQKLASALKVNVKE